jgi:hypothetical protein
MTMLIREQFRRNTVALVSLLIAVSSLAYTGWRNETSEHQRSVRQAGFRVLEELGELQQVVLYRAYFAPPEQGDAETGRLRVSGYGSVLLIRDLMNILPDPGPAQAVKLETLWNQQVDNLSTGANTRTAVAASDVLSEGIDEARAVVVDLITMLD